MKNIRVILKTLKLNNRSNLLQSVAQTTIDFNSVKSAERFLKSYIYKLDADLSTGSLDVWSKKVVTQHGIYTFHAELTKEAA
jgi:hypothetical protein